MTWAQETGSRPRCTGTGPDKPLPPGGRGRKAVFGIRRDCTAGALRTSSASGPPRRSITGAARHGEVTAPELRHEQVNEPLSFGETRRLNRRHIPQGR